MMSLGIIGGADGATAVFVYGVFVTGPDPKFWAMLALGGVLAYLLGSVDFGILVSKYLYHDDIRTHGSGNAGSTNILRTFGLKAALLTALGDIGKGAVSTLLGRFIVEWGTGDPALGVYGAYLAAFCAVCGPSGSTLRAARALPRRQGPFWPRPRWWCWRWPLCSLRWPSPPASSAFPA